MSNTRSLVKSWDNRTRSSARSRYKTWTRRVRWYEGNDIRLCFEDEERLVNRVYKDKNEAQADYDAFRSGVISTGSLQK